MKFVFGVILLFCFICSSQSQKRCSNRSGFLKETCSNKWENYRRTCDCYCKSSSPNPLLISGYKRRCFDFCGSSRFICHYCRHIRTCRDRGYWNIV